MGGLGPGIGGLEYIVIGLVALLVLGPERLPVMMRKIGQWVGKARRMADEFRSSFEDMARQSELDDLRKEVEALRRGQGMMPLGADAERTFQDINASLGNAPLPALGQAVPVDPTPVPVTEPEAPSAKPVAKPASRKKASSAPKSAAKPKAKSATKSTGAATKPKARAKPAASRKKAVDQ